MRDATEIVIVSPFIDEILITLICGSTGDKLTRAFVVTRLVDTPQEAYQSANRLIRLLEWAQFRPNLVLTIHDDPKLHGKIYLAKHGATFDFGLLGSANCTNNGLIRNHEWSAAIPGPDIDQLWEEIQKALPREKPLSREDLGEIAEAAKRLIEENREALRAVKLLRLNLNSILPKLKVSTITLNQTLGSVKERIWIKPVGDSNKRIKEDEDYWTDPHELHFARKPSGVYVGDWVIAYATGWKKLVGVFEVTEGPHQQTDFSGWPEGERWPWILRARPLTPNFARSWIQENLLLQSIVETFEAQQAPKEELEKAGKLIAAIRQGNDKIRLMPLLAKFIVDQIFRRESLQ